MAEHLRVKKKRRDVKIYYIRRENNIFIVSDAKGNGKANKQEFATINRNTPQ